MKIASLCLCAPDFLLRKSFVAMLYSIKAAFANPFAKQIRVFAEPIHTIIGFAKTRICFANGFAKEIFLATKLLRGKKSGTRSHQGT